MKEHVGKKISEESGFAVPIHALKKELPDEAVIESKYVNFLKS